MPTIVLDQPVPLAVRELERSLCHVVPTFKWRAGDDSTSAAVALHRPVTVLGLAGAEVVMMVVELRMQPLPLEAGAPPHQLHIHVSQPSTDHAEVAKRMLVLTAAIILDGTSGFAQLVPEGPWYHSGELKLGLERLMSDPARASVDEFLVSYGQRHPSAAAAGVGEPSPLDARGIAPGSPEQRMMMSDLDHTFAKILTDIGGAEFAKQMGHAPPPTYAEEEPRIDRLPTFVLALDHPLEFDWQPVMDIGRLDPPGQWQAHPGPKGTGSLTGRGCTVTIEMSADAIPRYILNNALARSFWFQAGPDAFRAHSCSLILTCDIDTRAVPFEDVRETAKVITLLLGLLTRSPGCIALLNNGIHTVLDSVMVQSQVGHLHKNQIPVMLWTWTAPDSLVRDSVSMTTGGLLPFLGYEIEIWNAPGEPSWVGDKLGHIINYLLHVGPIVKDGESFGESKGDRSIRGYFGTTKAQRADKSVKVLLLEFDSPPGVTRPQPDAAPQPERPAGAFPRGTRFFGRRGT